MKTTYHLWRLIYLLPVFWLQLQFNDMMLALVFGFVMGFLTSKLFPIVEFTKSKEENT
jgi:multisubunit Na+/H+ antiporter MnhE subunit